MRVLLLGVAVLAGSALAAPPLELKGLGPGVSLEVFMEAMPYANCLAFASDLSDEVCRARERTFAGVSVDYTGFSILGYIESLQVQYRAVDQDVMVDSLIAKYGQPAKRLPRTVQNRLGARFDYEVLIWRDDVNTLTLSKYGTSLDRGLMVLSPTTPSDRAERHRRERVRGRASDM